MNTQPLSSLTFNFNLSNTFSSSELQIVSGSNAKTQSRQYAFRIGGGAFSIKHRARIQLQTISYIRYAFIGVRACPLDQSSYMCSAVWPVLEATFANYMSTSCLASPRPPVRPSQHHTSVCIALTLSECGARIRRVLPPPLPLRKRRVSALLRRQMHLRTHAMRAIMRIDDGC